MPVGSEWDQEDDEDDDGDDGESTDRQVYRRGREAGERLKLGLDELREVVGSVTKV